MPDGSEFADSRHAHCGASVRGVYALVYVCMYVCMYVRMYIYIYTHTYIYIYIYIYRGSGAPCPPPPTWSMVQHAPPPRPPFVGGSPCGVAVGFWGLGLQVKGKRHRVDMSLGRVWGVGWLG